MRFRRLLNVANFISFSRIPMVILIIIFYDNNIVFYSLLALAIATDALDGYVARKRGTTRDGAVVDALCDKIFIVVLLAYILFRAGLTVPQFVLLILRDIYMTGLFIAMAFYPRRYKFRGMIRSRWGGKITTVLQFAAIIWFFAGIAYFRFVPYAVALVSVWAIVDYTIVVRKALRRR